MPGKSKIEIKYIPKKRKRNVSFNPSLTILLLLGTFLIVYEDALYKRRRGLVKKAHELSVICGMSISIVCTDFENTCFTFCNDKRLEVDLPPILKLSKGQISLTQFEPSQVNFFTNFFLIFHLAIK